MIDFHVHAGNFAGLREDIQGLLTRRPFEPGVDVSRVFSSGAALEAYLRSHGVERAVVFAECGPGTNFTIDSEMIVAIVGGSPFFVPFGSINPNYHDVLAELEHSLKLGVRGFKFYPADHGFDPYLEPMLHVYRRCEQLGLPVVFHTGSTAQRDAAPRFVKPVEFEQIVRDFPGLTIVLAHAGKPDWHQSAKDMALRYGNVYLDTALVEPANLIKEYGDLRDLGSKLLFGSDWPVVGSYTALMDKLRAVGIAADVAEQVFRGNARRILDAVA
jgi:uncharacterized protein